MKVTAVDQFIPSLATRDAVGSHTLHLQSLIRELGYSSELYVGNAAPELLSRTKKFSEYRGGDGKVMLYQASTGSEIASFLAARTEPLLMSYHNLTPADLFEAWEPHVGLELEAGRQQITALAARTFHAIADSEFNRNELDAMGYPSTSVSPPMVDSVGEMAADSALLDWLSHWRKAEGSVVIFVGRLAPNKAQHDLIKAFAAFRQIYDPKARLCLVGSAASPRYESALRSFVEGLGLSRVVDLPGGVSGAELAAYYQSADVFACLSDHEGYCVPLIEAMHYGVPVVAYGSSAISETAGTAALILANKSPLQVAAAMNRAVTDIALKDELIKRGRRRAAELSLSSNMQRYKVELVRALGSLL